MDKPYSPSCERNRQPILKVLSTVFADRHKVLEIGSGNGQHAVHFAAALPHLLWQTSDRTEHLAGIRLWLDEATLPNTPPPLSLNVSGPWPKGPYDAIFTANTLHIMAWSDVQALFAKLPNIASAKAKLVVYGPFNYDGHFSSASNEAFDVWLKDQGPHMGIRDAEAVDALARETGFVLQDDLSMPANNRCRIWQRTEGIRGSDPIHR